MNHFNRVAELAKADGNTVTTNPDPREFEYSEHYEGEKITKEYFMSLDKFSKLVDRNLHILKHK